MTENLYFTNRIKDFQENLKCNSAVKPYQQIYKEQPDFYSKSKVDTIVTPDFFSIGTYDFFFEPEFSSAIITLNTDKSKQFHQKPLETKLIWLTPSKQVKLSDYTAREDNSHKIFNYICISIKDTKIFEISCYDSHYVRVVTYTISNDDNNQNDKIKLDVAIQEKIFRKLRSISANQEEYDKDFIKIIVDRIEASDDTARIFFREMDSYRNTLYFIVSRKISDFLKDRKSAVDRQSSLGLFEISNPDTFYVNFVRNYIYINFEEAVTKIFGLNITKEQSWRELYKYLVDQESILNNISPIYKNIHPNLANIYISSNRVQQYPAYLNNKLEVNILRCFLPDEIDLQLNIKNDELSNLASTQGKVISKIKSLIFKDQRIKNIHKDIWTDQLHKLFSKLELPSPQILIVHEQNPGFLTIALPPGGNLFDLLRKLNQQEEIKFAEPVELCRGDTAIDKKDKNIGFAPPHVNTVPCRKRDNILKYIAFHLYIDKTISNYDVLSKWGVTKLDFPDIWGLSRGSKSVYLVVIDSPLEVRLFNDSSQSCQVMHDAFIYSRIQNIDFISNNDSTLSNSTTPHGTNVVSVCTGTDIDQQYVSAAPKCSLLHLWVDIDKGVRSTIVDTIYYIIGLARKYPRNQYIINCSYGLFNYTYSYHQAMIEAYNQANIYVVTSSGNTSKDLHQYSQYPACFKKAFGFNRDMCLTIASASWQRAASNEVNELVPAGKFGLGIVDFYAPGSDIRVATAHNEYDSESGTSLASPLVSSIIALILSIFPYSQSYLVFTDISPSQKQRLKVLFNAFSRQQKQAILDLLTIQQKLAIFQQENIAPEQLRSDDIIILFGQQDFTVRQQRKWINILNPSQQDFINDLLIPAQKQQILNALKNTCDKPQDHHIKYGNGLISPSSAIEQLFFERFDKKNPYIERLCRTLNLVFFVVYKIFVHIYLLLIYEVFSQSNILIRIVKNRFAKIDQYLSNINDFVNQLLRLSSRD